MTEWQPINTAPKNSETFVFLYCPEDNSRWFASWQGGEWFGVDDCGLRRAGHCAGDSNYFTGWFVSNWMPLPSAPKEHSANDRNN